MNILKKLTMGGLFATLATVCLAAPVQARAPFALLMPELSALTSQVGAQIGERIAVELETQLVEAVAAPRALRRVRTASVVITESNAIVVEATRLPPIDALAQADEGNHIVPVRF